MMAPAMTGPSSRAALYIRDVSPIALTRYSVGTVVETSEVRAGCWITCIMPATTAAT